MADLGKITIHITANVSPPDVATCNEIFDRYLRERPYDLKIVVSNRTGAYPPVWIEAEKIGEKNEKHI